jgi:hypothetical protein
MKKVMFALCFMFGGVVAVTAQDAQDTTSNQYRTETQTGDQSQNQDPSQAQDTSQSQDQSQYAQGLDQDRERIQSTELPEEVQRSLENQEYRGWLISGAYKAKGASDQSSMESDTTSTEANRDATGQDNANATGAQAEEVYIVELKNGAQTKTVRFDKNGQKIEGMDEESQSGQNENNQYNQNDQSSEMNQNDQADPNAADPSSSQSTDQTTPQSSESTDSQTDQSTETQSTESQNDQSTETQTDQSKANDPK